MGVFILANEIVGVLYPRLAVNEKTVLITLLKAAVLNIVFLSLLSTTNSVLLSLNKNYVPLLSVSVGIILKTIFTIILVSNAKIGILGAVISQVICYFVAFSINLYYIIRVNNFKINWLLKGYKPVTISLVMGIGVYYLKNLLALRVSLVLLLVFSILFGIILFGMFLFIFKEIDINKLKRLKR